MSSQILLSRSACSLSHGVIVILLTCWYLCKGTPECLFGSILSDSVYRQRQLKERDTFAPTWRGFCVKSATPPTLMKNSKDVLLAYNLTDNLWQIFHIPPILKMSVIFNYNNCCSQRPRPLLTALAWLLRRNVAEQTILRREIRNVA